MPSDSVAVGLITTFGVVSAPILLAVVNHLLKQRGVEREAARKALSSQQARTALSRVAASRRERRLRGQWRRAAGQLQRERIHNRRLATEVERLRAELAECRSSADW